MDSLRVVSRTLRDAGPDIRGRLPEDADFLVSAGKIKGAVNVVRLMGGSVWLKNVEIDDLDLNLVAFNDSVNNYDIMPSSGDKDFAVNDVEAAYEPATGVMSIECGQHLFDFKSGNYTYPISLLAIRKVSAGWNISAEGSMRLLRTERGFEVLADSDVIGFYLGMINPDTGGFSGFGGAIYPPFPRVQRSDALYGRR